MSFILPGIGIDLALSKSFGSGLFDHIFLPGSDVPDMSDTTKRSLTKLFPQLDLSRIWRMHSGGSSPLKHYSRSKLTRPTSKKTGKHIKIVVQHRDTTVANLTVVMTSPPMPKL